MSAETAMPSVCFLVDTIGYETGGGHFWAYLNWALGAKSLGCRVRWLEIAPRSWSGARVSSQADRVAEWLSRFGLGDTLAVCQGDGGDVMSAGESPSRGLDWAAESDLLVNFRYGTSTRVVSAFHRSVLVDIDPGLLQVWMANGLIDPAPHDAYVTTGEGVGSPSAGCPDVGLRWLQVPPAVSLEHWPVVPLPAGGALTTISHWWADEWVEWNGELWSNDKRSGFLPFLDIARDSPVPMALALCLGDDEGERSLLEDKGWRLLSSETVADDPSHYQAFVWSSLGEFSCTKPSCQRLPTGWVSDRTLCYLASGRPAVVQDTGASARLPDARGVLRFRTPAEALQRIREVAADPEFHAKEARSLAEQHFDAQRCVRHLLTEVAA